MIRKSTPQEALVSFFFFFCLFVVFVVSFVACSFGLFVCCVCVCIAHTHTQADGQLPGKIKVLGLLYQEKKQTKKLKTKTTPLPLPVCPALSRKGGVNRSLAVPTCYRRKTIALAPYPPTRPPVPTPNAKSHVRSALAL